MKKTGHIKEMLKTIRILGVKRLMSSMIIWYEQQTYDEPVSPEDAYKVIKEFEQYLKSQVGTDVPVIQKDIETEIEELRDETG